MEQLVARQAHNLEVARSNPASAGVEQLVARQAHNLEVARSNPASATTAAGRLLFFVVRAERESCLLSFRAWLRYKKSGRQF